MTITAPYPPKGWNSWDCYGASVTEAEVLQNATYMANYLKPFGWEYIVVDIQWYEPEALSSVYNAFFPLEMDSFSRLIPATNRFPSAKNGQGFKPLATKIHKLGLKFGIHVMRGIPRQAVHQNTALLGTTKKAREIAHPNSICPWNTDMYGVDANKEGAQAYYNSLFELYAAWGVDYVKVDDIAASCLYDFHEAEINLIRKAIDRCGRKMVLSLSPGPAPLEHAEFLKSQANMWRMTDDFWDHWDYLYPMFERCEKWAEHVGEGHWPDCDMLPLGHIGIRSVDGGGADRFTRFTKDEQMTMMTLWCIFRSPLMFGGELTDNDEWTFSLLTHKELLTMHQSLSQSKQISRSAEQIIWKGVAGEVNYLALFNVGEADTEITVNLEKLNLTPKSAILNIWDAREIPFHNVVTFQVPQHGTVLLKIK